MWAIPTVLVLFILGPLLLGGWILTVVLPFTLIALRGKMHDPPAQNAGDGQ